MASPVEPVDSKDLAFRRICKERCKWAIACSVSIQFFFMAIFLLFVNFNILHPISWIHSTIRVLLSFYTWLAPIPLAAAVIIHGIVMVKPCLVESKYHPTHFSRCYRELVQRSILLVSNGTVGCLTAWLYTRFLRDDYRLLFLPGENHSTVLNERLIYLVLCGLFAGCYLFARNQFNSGAIDVAVISQRKVIQVRNCFYRILSESMKKSFLVSLMYVSAYFTFSLLFRCNIALLLGGVRLQEESIMYHFYSVTTDMRLLLYTWLLISLILSNVSLIHVLFCIFLSEPMQFTLETSTSQDAAIQPLLADALTYSKIPLVQQLAADDLLVVADGCETDRRCALYLLTNPGGHPKNWRKLCDTCIKLIRDFTHDLDQSIEGIEPKPRPPIFMMGGTLRPTTSMDRERFLMRQYNQSFGVRSLSRPSLGKSSGNLNQSEQVTEQKGKRPLAAVLHRVPGYDYVFVECKSAKTCYLLSAQTHLIVKITQSLATIVSRSLIEDQYGVVQNDIPSVAHTLLELKKVLEKIGSINIDVKKIDRNYIALTGAVKRSIYKFTVAFKPYIKDLLLDPKDLEELKAFLNFCEV